MVATAGYVKQTKLGRQRASACASVGNWLPLPGVIRVDFFATRSANGDRCWCGGVRGLPGRRIRRGRSSGGHREVETFVYVLLFCNSLRLQNRLVGAPLGLARFHRLPLGKGEGCAIQNPAEHTTATIPIFMFWLLNSATVCTGIASVPRFGCEGRRVICAPDEESTMGYQGESRQAQGTALL
jgi:hypothetical protein